MADRSDEQRGPAVLVGEAAEDWTGDAVFYEYSAAADPVAAGSIAPVPARRFSPGLHAGGGSRIIPLDLSGPLGVPYPATSPGLLASFVVIDPAEPVVTAPTPPASSTTASGGGATATWSGRACPAAPPRAGWRGRRVMS